MGELLENVFSALVLLGFAATAVGLLWRSWVVWQTDDIAELTFTTVLTLCVPFAGLLLSRGQDPRERRPIAVIIGGLGLVLVAGFALQSLRHESAVEMKAAAASAALELAATSAHAPSPAVVDPDGSALDVSTIMGRAQVRANAWQPEAALVGIEVTQLTGRGVQTDAGGTAKFRYGPSPFRPATAGGSFVVSYDRSGLRSSTSKDQPGQTLPEPMCSPEEVYRKAVGEGGTKPIRLTYEIDVNGQAAWHARDPARPEVKPQVFDRQNCMPRANTRR